MMNVYKGEIRQAKETDWQQMYALSERVFMRKDEARFFKQLKENGDLVLTLIRERNAAITGVIAFSRIKINNDQSTTDALVMAPFLIDPIWQSKGLGSELIERSHQILKNKNERLIFVLGEEEYYSRFGYNHKDAEPFDSPYAGPFLLACKLSKDIPDKGKLIYPQAFADVIG